MEGRIDAMLEWRESIKEPTLTEIEEMMLALRKEMAKEIIEMLLEGEEAREPVEEQKCPQCGKAMMNKGKQTKRVGTRIGTIEVERDYYYCGECKEGVFPLDEQLAIWDKKWSEGVAKQAVKWGRRLTFEEATEALQELGQIEISKSSIWRRVKKWEEIFQEIERKKQGGDDQYQEQDRSSPGRSEKYGQVF